jgi:hypothetical protein
MNETVTLTFDDPFSSLRKIKNREAENALISRILETILEVTSELDSGTFVVRFSSIGPDTLSIYYSESSEVARENYRAFNTDDFVKLQEIMNEENIGTWLSVSFSFNCATHECKVSYNRNKRFNTFADNWHYSEDDSIVSPSRDDFLLFFKQFPRIDDCYPDWFSQLKIEKERVEERIASARSSEVFSEALQSVPEFEKDYAKLSSVKSLSEVWNLVSDFYEKELLKNKDILPYFIDEELFVGQADAIYEEIEPRVASDVLAEIVEKYSLEHRAGLINSIFEAQGQSASYEITDDELEDIDTEDLDDDLQEHIYTFVMSQTRQRFPDLENRE